MTSDGIRSQLLAEISELSKRRMETNRQATFGGWTREVEDEHERIADRIADLRRQLDALG